MPDIQATPSPANAFVDPEALLDPHGPFNAAFLVEAIQTLMRAHPLSAPESASADRDLRASLIALAATNPCDPIEVMLGVQALSAYQGACFCWRIGMDTSNPVKERIKHMAAAATAAQTFETMVRAIERRQAKPLAVPAGRPKPRTWSEAKSLDTLVEFASRVRRVDAEPPRG
jgi:hypothetical protein